MPDQLFDLNPVDTITTGTIGPPGERVFYLQGKKDTFLVTLIYEKIQAAALSMEIFAFLDTIQKEYPNLDPASALFEESSMELDEPVQPLFRAGQIRLGFDSGKDLALIEVHEFLNEEEKKADNRVVHFWCTRSQIRNLGKMAELEIGRGRKICGNCGQFMDPAGHFCPKSNGNKP